MRLSAGCSLYEPGMRDTHRIARAAGYFRRFVQNPGVAAYVETGPEFMSRGFRS